MNVLFIGGHSNAGKTSLFCSIKPMLNIIKEQPNGEDGKDYLALAQDKNGNYFILNSSSDQKQQIDNLINFIDECKKEVSLINNLVLAIRSDKDPMRNYLLKELKNNQLLANKKDIIEFPIARIHSNISNSTYDWYKKTAKNLIFRILNKSPFLLNI